ncbi:hypothetical protein WA026_013551 [Henosepilachna vigintioctopunctata]|uniref:N-acetyltransferase domain-containing protein n=1 Tax=Henosepilachna vigintioctopunctata TaxID=420089 RepID=A0AAW1VCM8_9CUCU
MISMALLHKKPEYMQKCCELINTEWKRSDTARMRSLENSCDSLPCNIILLQDKVLIGHLKLSSIPSIPEACFVESVVILKSHRGMGYGTKIMNLAEEYCRDCLKLREIYLSTKGQEQFYRKLGYVECPPVSIYGCPINTFRDLSPPPGTKIIAMEKKINNNMNVKQGLKIYMQKILC